MRKTATAFLLAALGACGGGPSEEDRTLTLFDRVAYLLSQYNAALASQEGLRVEAATSDLRRLATAEFDRLLPGLSSEDPIRQAEAAFALGFSRRREALEPLTRAAASTSSVVRSNAVAGLGMLGFEEGAAALFGRFLEDPESDVRVAALFGLRNLVNETRDLGLLSAVHGRLADASPGVRNEALILLRSLKRTESIEPVLARSVKDLEPLVRANAALALGAIGPAAAKTATPQLIEMLRDEVAKVVDSAWKALCMVHQKDFDRSYATWRDWYEDELRHHWTCTDHREISEADAGDCPLCRRKLERILRETGRKIEPASPYFVCPAHPEVSTSTAAPCGKAGCGKTTAPGKAPTVAYVCPEHADVQTLGPTSCARPGCGKALVPRK